MSIHHRDLAQAAEKLNRTDASFQPASVALSNLIEELEKVAFTARTAEFPLNAVSRKEQIRDMRIEFGFAPDDEPKAHLRPLAI